MKRGEWALALGLGGVAVGAALAQLVLIGLVGLALLVVAHVLLFRAGLVIGPDEAIPVWRHVAGFILFLAGVFLLIALAFQATSLAHGEALQLQRGLEATGVHWPWLLLQSTAPAAMLTVGLHLRSATPWPRLLAWALATWSVPPLAVFLFRLFAQSQPIAA